ncbi:cation:proton antiporter [Arcanobacterium haemolyticum]|nr:cation:proton antiporter [Arcanobacterium haemolyticum]
MEIVIALGLVAICLTSLLGPRLNVAAPLLLVLLGAAVGFIPGVPLIHIEPELVLTAMLPPLLYAAAIEMPVMDFRREFAPIAGLSVLLVIASSVFLGLVMWVLIPELDLPWAIALGAVLSPTDAVATSIVKSTNVSPRITAILEGEGLLNDATALVMLRTAVAAAAASFSALGVAWLVVYSVAIASIIGIAVGRCFLWAVSRIDNAVAATTLSFAVPFIAMIPAEELGASGLVAAVVAGLVIGQGSAKYIAPSMRIFATKNWATLEFLLEGIVFLTMGLQLHSLVADLQENSVNTVLRAAGLAIFALVGSIIIRAAFVAPLLAWIQSRARRRARLRPRFEQAQNMLSEETYMHLIDEVRDLNRRRGRKHGRNSTGRSFMKHKDRFSTDTRNQQIFEHQATTETTVANVCAADASELERASSPRRPGGAGGKPPAPAELSLLENQLRGTAGRSFSSRRVRRLPWRLLRRIFGWRGSEAPTLAEVRTRFTRAIADIDYFVESPLTVRDGAVVVWAGMRGAITVAAAQTLPTDTPMRSYLIFIAFLVAGFSLIIQGGTLRWFVETIKPTRGPSDDERATDIARLREILDEAERVFLDNSNDDDDIDLGVLEARRAALLHVRDEQTFHSSLLSDALTTLDVQQFALEALRTRPI